MPHKKDFFRTGSILPITLGVVAFFTFLSVIGIQANVFNGGVRVDMLTEPSFGSMLLGETFTVDITVASNIPVNVFAGEILFNNEVLAVSSIDYNTSIADLWAKKPWYSNGDGVITYAGGTTQEGGFSGSGTLLTVTFKTIALGSGHISIENGRILQHDGLGTEAPVSESIDAIFTVDNPSTKSDVLHKSTRDTSYVVTKQPVSTDLNGDGKQSMSDVSIFMVHLTTRNTRSDFDEDGTVGLKDLNILLGSKK